MSFTVRCPFDPMQCRICGECDPITNCTVNFIFLSDCLKDHSNLDERLYIIQIIAHAVCFCNKQHWI